MIYLEIPYHSFVMIKFLIISFNNVLIKSITILLDRPVVIDSKNHKIIFTIILLLKILLLILLFF